MRPIRYLDVCSGYSAFTLGAQGLGFECVGYSEIEAFPAAILGSRYGATRARYMPDPDEPGLMPKERRARIAMRKAMSSLPASQFGNAVTNFGDFTQIREDDICGPVDLLTGGTPCQAFSVAGKRLGLDDPRGNLTLEFLALARRLRVPWLAWENVPGFLSHDDGRTMGTFLRLLGECGYGWAYRVLDAQFIRVDGHERAVPQRRRRVFVVAHLGGSAGPAAVLFERESLRGDPAPRRETGEGVAPTISARTKGGGGLGTDFDCDGGLIAAEVASTLPAGGNSTGGHRQPGTSAETAATMLLAQPFRVTPSDGAYSTGSVAASLTTGTDGTSISLVEPVCIHTDAVDRDGEALTPSIDANGVARLRNAGMGISEGTADGLTTGKPHAIAFAQNTRDEVRLFGEDGQTVGALAADAGMKQTCYVAQPLAYSIMPQNSSKDYKAREVDVAQPLMAGGPVGGNQGGDYIADQWAVRRLTPTECERLMGVADGFTAITYRGKPAADGPRYKVLGNSQAANNMRWIARGLRDAIDAQGATK